MRTNVKVKAPKQYTHEGAVAANIGAEAQLRRSVMSCLLWEASFYENGVDIGERIRSLVAQVKPHVAAEVAVEARCKMKLRHVPLLIVREMARLPEHKKLVGKTLFEVIQRPDEITEFLSLYWKSNDGKRTLSAQVKKALAHAFGKFDEYALAKYNRDGSVKLRDVLFLAHSDPGGAGKYTKAERKEGVQRTLNEREALYLKLVTGTLETPDTWEVALSAGADKKEAFERLMAEKKLGALAFLRNLRNMHWANVSKSAVASYAESVNLSRVLPFRFVAAARAAPQWEDVVDTMFMRCAQSQEKLLGKTVLVVDISGSMYRGQVSSNSDMTRLDAAGALAAIVREVAEDPRIYATAGNDITRIHKTAPMPPRRGMAIIDVVAKREMASALGGGGIFLHQCLSWIKEREHDADRIIVITDEQDCDTKLKPADADAFGKVNYLINISVERNGIGYKPNWTHIDGWSESVIDYIRESELSSPTGRDV